MMRDIDALAVAARPVVLEKLAVATREQVSPMMLDHADVSVVLDQMTGHLVASLVSYVLAEKLAEDERSFTWRWPASSWQRFKTKHLPTLLRWRLVPKIKYHTESVTVGVKSWATFPKSTIAVPGLGAPVYFQQVETV